MSDQPIPAPSEVPPRQPKRSSWRTKVLILFLSVLFSIGLAEFAVRLLFKVTDVPFMFWDPLIGPRRTPNQSGRYLFGKEIDSRYRFNSQGWNSLHEYIGNKPKGTRRVCLIGDSFVEALSVDVDKTMAADAEKIMSRPDRPVEWYAFGNSGWGTSHEYLAFHHYALDFKPDAVVLLFICNDPGDTSPYLTRQEPWMAKFSLDDNGNPLYSPPAEYVPSAMKRWFARSALVRYLMIQKGLFTPRATVPTGQMSVREFAGTGKDDSGDLSPQQRVDKSWELIGKLLDKTRRECEARGAVFLLVFQGHRWEIEAAATGKTYMAPAKEVDPYCQNERINDMGRQYLEPLAKKLGLNYLDLTDSMTAGVKIAGKRHNYSDDAHFNELGHRIAAEAISQKLEDLWSKPAPKNN